MRSQLRKSINRRSNIQTTSYRYYDAVHLWLGPAHVRWPNRHRFGDGVRPREHGIVSEVGEGISRLTEGDRVVLPFNVSCGFCENCEVGHTGYCSNVNPGFDGGAYGYAMMGPYQGGQAEKLRVPYADFNALKLPDGREHENSFALLADIFPTGWHGTRLADLQPGESVVIYGAGPVGTLAAYSAKLQGASEIYIVDRVPSRLDMVEEHCDAIPINFEDEDPIERIVEMTGGGTDKVSTRSDTKRSILIRKVTEPMTRHEKIRQSSSTISSEQSEQQGKSASSGSTSRQIPVRLTRRQRDDSGSTSGNSSKRASVSVPASAP